MDKCCTKFPPEIKARWDALARDAASGKQGIEAEKLDAFTRYLFSKDVAKPEQVTAFAELMQRLPVKENPPEGEQAIAAYLFDALYKKYHHDKGERKAIHAITKSLLKAQHGAALTFIAGNHLGDARPGLADLVDKALGDACTEVLVKPREHAKQTEQALKSASRRHLLHEIDSLMKSSVHGREDDGIKFSTTEATVLVKPEAAERGSDILPVTKRDAHRVLSPSKRAEHNDTPHEAPHIVKRADHRVLTAERVQAAKEGHTGRFVPVQRELFGVPPVRFVPDPNPAKGLVIRNGASTWVTEQVPRGEPTPVTEAEIAKAARKKEAAERRKAYIEGGGFVGMVRRALSSAEPVEQPAPAQKELFDETAPASSVPPIAIADDTTKVAANGGLLGGLGRAMNISGFAGKIASERTQAPNIGGDDMVRGK